MWQSPFYTVRATRYGIEGVAVAWLLRVAVDTLSMVFLVQRLEGNSKGFVWLVIGCTVSAMVLLGLAGEIDSLPGRMSLLCLLLLACGIFLPRQLRLLGQATSSFNPSIKP